MSDKNNEPDLLKKEKIDSCRKCGSNNLSSDSKEKISCKKCGEVFDHTTMYFYTVDTKKCKDEVEKLVDEKLKDVVIPDASADDEKLFKENMKSFATSRVYCTADQELAKKEIEIKAKKIDTSEPKSEGPTLPQIDSKKMLDGIALGGLAAILILIGVSVFAVDCCVETAFAASEILNSNFMVVLTSTVIAPMITRVMKEKFDIDIDASKISMLFKDGIKAVNQYQKLADKLRDKNGNISDDNKKKLRDLAYTSMKDSFDVQKYKDVISSTGAQIFDKAIEHAVKKNWIDNKPIEKDQVEALIKQSIDAYPQIVEWKNLDPEVKDVFVDGHIQRLIKNAGLDGWGKAALDNIFDAEVSNRLVQAALLDQKDLTKYLESKNKYLKYTGSVMEVLLKNK
jgi:transcription initiation factor TFIIIB Brf1 subunit/transcription initiation factor TFIIB